MRKEKRWILDFPVTEGDNVMDLILVARKEKQEMLLKLLQDKFQQLTGFHCVTSWEEVNPFVASLEQCIVVVVEDEEPVAIASLIRIKKDNPTLAIVMIFREKDLIKLQNALNAGLDGAVFQPFDQEAFLSVLEGILERLQAQKEHEHKLQEKLFRFSKQVRTEFVYDLIFGNVASIREAQEMLNFLDIDKMPNCVMLVSIDNFAAITADLSQMRKRELRLGVLKEIQRTTALCESGLTAMVAEDRFVIVFNLEFQDQDQVIKDSCKIAKFIKNCVDKATSTSVSIGIGWRYGNIRNLNISFQEAQSALEHRFFKGRGKVIHIGQVEPFHQGVTLFSPAAKAELVSKVRFGDGKGAEEILDEIITGTLFQSYPSPEIVQARCLELVVSLLRAAVEGGVNSQKIACYSSHYVRELFNLDTAQKLREYLHELISQITDEIKESHSGRNLKLIQKAVNFIHANYQQDLSLEEAARSIGLSSYYFSHIFKKEMGKTFIEYLTEVRIEQAKKLLAETDLNIAEVSREVGYQDPKYFSRVFKNLVGMPPSKFT